MLIERTRPIADQVKSILRRRIRNSDFGASGRLPSETELAAELGVSRATVRTAMSALAAEGWVVRRQGDGTYVNKRGLALNTRIETVWEFTRLIEDSGRRPAIQVLSAEVRGATEQEATALELASRAAVLALVRLFTADGQPVILSTNVIPTGLLDTDQIPQSELGVSITEFLKQHCGREFAYAVADISAALAGPEVREGLQLQPGSPLLKFVEVFYDIEDQPLIFALNYYDDKILRLRVVRS